MTVDVTDRNGVAVITLDRAPVNAFSLHQIEATIDAFNRVASDENYSAALLTGANKVFTAGIDIGGLARLDAEGLRDIIRGVNRVVHACYRFPKPLVAAVPGHAVGLGTVLLLCCDFRIVAHGEYRLGLNELDAGLLFPAGPTALVQAELSPAARRFLCLGGGLYGPDSPHLQELIDETVEPGALLDRAIALAKDRGGQAIYGAVKHALRATTIEKLRHIAEQDDDPLLAQAEELVKSLAQLVR